MKGFTAKVLTGFGIAAVAATIFAGPAAAATGSPSFADRGTVSVSGGYGSTVVTTDFRTGSQGITRTGLVATLPKIDTSHWMTKGQSDNIHTQFGN